jgi:mersacidin/lichenicidin family type 2 lantibiotic
MSDLKTIRAWKDPEYRESLTAEELALMPSNPAGPIDLTDSDLAEISGGVKPPTTQGGPCSNPCPATHLLCPHKTLVTGGCPILPKAVLF